MKVNIRSDSPTLRVRNTDVPTVGVRYSSFMSPADPGMVFAGPGYLIGMLGMTYTKIQSFGSTPAMFNSDDIPRVRIRNTD